MVNLFQINITVFKRSILMSFKFEEGHLAQMIPSNKSAASKWFAAMEEILPKERILCERVNVQCVTQKSICGDMKKMKSSSARRVGQS